MKAARAYVRARRLPCALPVNWSHAFAKRPRRHTAARYWAQAREIAQNTIGVRLRATPLPCERESRTMSQTSKQAGRQASKRASKKLATLGPPCP
eukprot:14521314-Alexandrium_andersonii.AAC.1